MAPCLLGKLSTKFIIYQEYNIEYSLDFTLFNSKLVQCVGIMKDMQCLRNGRSSAEQETIDAMHNIFIQPKQ